MPTPAVNVAINRSITALRTWQYADGSVGSDSFPNQRREHFRRNRPASAGVPVINDWRSPRPWSHSGYTVVGNPSDVFIRYTGNRTPPISPSLYVEEDWWDGGYWGAYCTPDPPANPDVSGLVTQAKVKALNKLKNSNFNLGVFLGEAKETQSLLIQTVGRIASSVTNFRRGASRKTWNAIVGRGGERGGKIPDAWLEVQYGWNPLMSDVLGSCQYLDALSRGNPPVMNVKATAFDRSVVNNHGTGTYGSTFTHRWDYRLLASVSLWYELQNPTLHELASLGLLNPLEIVWELVPYSFVIDWFLPVGSWLSTLDAAAGFKYVSGTTSTMIRYDVSAPDYTLRQPYGPSYEIIGGGLGVSGRGFAMNRVVEGSSPVPGLYVKSPISAGHIANAMSLLISAFR